ncbi:hypothetical protein H0H87_012559 [Tephrocybe sp. NHM501043]|nr:hypothetical protein H0H87_012559 [Tephrocybe sp. NHM501043]
MLKQAGYSHNPAGTAATKPGECAILCPACPYEKLNFSEGWKDAPPQDQFLYSLFIVNNANFHLKHKNVSSNEVDPGLSKGWPYFVHEDDFKGFLGKFDKLIV